MSQDLKQSRYNHFVEIEDGKRLAFNALSCGLAEMDEDSYNRYRQLVEDRECSDLSSCSELLSDLKMGGFLVPEDVDELDAIRAGHYQSRFGNKGFGLTLIPTYNCNFACDYCYENSELHSMSRKEGSVMSEEVCDNIVKLCEQRIEPKSTFAVTWYGGEPLMGKNVIEKLTKEFIRICGEKESQYHAGIITNGYLLSAENLQFLLDSRVTFAQVTIDGPKEVHDQRRCLRSGGPTYDKIMSNLDNVDDDRGLEIAIRINIDKRNENKVPELLEDLRRRGMHRSKSVTIYFSQTVHYSNSCPDISTQCMVTREFSDFMIDAYKQALELGFRVSIYPELQISSCGAVGNGLSVIEPTGALHACWNTVGEQDKQTGTLTESGIQARPSLPRWLAWTPFRSQCEDCEVLPLCMGGCPYKTLFPSQLTKAEHNTCTWWKYNIKPMLDITKKARELGLFRIQKDDKTDLEGGDRTTGR